MNKKQRESNWGYQEKILLLSSIKDFINVIENKSIDSKSMYKKTEAWNSISKTFLLNGHERDLKKIKDQWKRMKIVAKQNISNHKKYQRGTGGGCPKKLPDEIDYTIEAMIPEHFIQDESDFDSDRNINHTVIIPENPEIELMDTNAILLPNSEDICNNITNLINMSVNTSDSMPCTSMLSDNNIIINNKEATCSKYLTPLTETRNCVILNTNINNHKNKAIPNSNTNNQKSKVQKCSKKRQKRENKMTTYEEKCFEMYRKKMILQMKHHKELHNTRKRWEEKIYQLKYDLLQKNVNVNIDLEN